MPSRMGKAKNSPFKAANVVGGVGFTIGAEDSNAITVAVQLKNARGENLNQRASVFAYLSDDAHGDTVVATAADGGVSAGTDGQVLSLVTGKAAQIVSEADGDVDFVITHTAGAKTCYLNVVLPDGSIVTSGAITFA